MKVLVSAYACEPDKGSEPAVGWNQVKQISRFHEIWVITRRNHRDAIESEARKEPIPNVHWVFFDLPRWVRFWKKGQRGVRAYYYLWQLGAYFLARDLHRKIGFDLAHHVTFVNYWRPSFLALLPIQFVWGPVGGGESAPASFRRSFSLRGRIYERLRDCARKLSEYDPWVRLTARRAAIALAATEQTAARLRSLGCRNVQMLLGIGLPSDELNHLRDFQPRESPPFRVVSVGNLIHWKGFELGLRAFAKFQSSLPDSEYWLIGDGPERKRLQQLAHRLGVSRNTKFMGKVAREQALQKIADCDVLLYPSLHDSGGGVCLETMAAGRPVICLDLGGPAVQITSETGVKIPARTPEQVVEEMVRALERLACDPALRAKLGQAGRARVQRDFNWNSKGDQINNIYSEAQNERPATTALLAAEQSARD